MARDELPEFIRHADGRQEPFEPELITRSLFAACARLGSPNAFLARELTESVLHFLTAESPESVVGADQLADLVSKVVRELGHPELALAYEHRGESDAAAVAAAPATVADWPAWFHIGESPWSVIRAAAAGPLTALALSRTFPAELASAHAEGLIGLTGLTTPLELAGVTHVIAPRSACADVFAAREVAGEFLAIDGPEFDLAAEPGDVAHLAERYVNELRMASAATGLQVILNLNSHASPPRHREGAGPLFAERGDADPNRRREIADELARRASDPCFTVWWHVAADTDPVRMTDCVGYAHAGRAIEFTVDRPSADQVLGPGLDRRTPATLLQVGVNLGRLVAMMGGAPVDAVAFLGKVASLARFAKTAGHAKQDFLRRHGRRPLREAFLLDRARLVLFPIGLAEASRATSRPPVEFARDILKTLRSAAEDDRPRKLPIRIDAPLAAGWDVVGEPGISLAQQVKTAGTLHGAAAAGRLQLIVEADRCRPADIADAIQLAARSAICRLRLQFLA